MKLFKRRLSMKTIFFIAIILGVYFHYMMYKMKTSSTANGHLETKKIDDMQLSPGDDKEDEEKFDIHRKEIEAADKQPVDLMNKSVPSSEMELKHSTTKHSRSSIMKRSILGKVNVYEWKDICIEIDNRNIYWNALFPEFPHRGYFMNRLEDGDWIRETSSRRFIGYLQVPSSGYYSFKVLSRDGAAFMIFDGLISNDRILLRVNMDKDEIIKQSKLIENNKEKMFDLYAKASKEIELKTGNKYPFDITHSCVYFGRLEIQIKRREEEDFKTIDSSYISSYYDTDNVNIKMPDAFFFNKTSTKLREKYKSDARMYFQDKTSVNSKTIATGLKRCKYEPSYILKDKTLQKYQGTQLVQRSLIYPDDNTKFPGKDLFKRLLDKSTAIAIANEVFETILKQNKGKYKLRNIVNVEENNEKKEGKRYFVELDLEDVENGRIYRFSDYFFKPSVDKPLCLPEDYSNWRNDVKVYMICTIKNQRPWVKYLIKSIEDLIQRTNDRNLHLILVDFNSTDINVEELVKESSLNYTFIRMSGKFSKAKALNEGVRRIPDDKSIVFVMDLHLQIPDHIFDQARKHTIEGKMTYCPILMRLECGGHPEFTNVSLSLWMDIGYGMMSLYKSDWLRIGGMDEQRFNFKWGGEDWEFVDRVLLGRLELEHQRLPGFYHIYHSNAGTWDGTKT